MKQYITEKQLNELTDKQKDKLRGWSGDPRKLATRLKPNEIEQAILDNYLDLPLLSIGQMIEFLDEYWNKFEQLYDETDGEKGEFEDRCLYRCADGCWYVQDPLDNNPGEQFELCDALWEAVKEILQ